MTISLSACSFSERKLKAGDIRLWKKTPAWELAKAVKKNDTVMIKRLLSESKVDIDYREPLYGESLLYWAVWNNQTNMVDFLLSQGANPNLHIWSNGESAITISSFYYDIDADILRLLLEYGGNPNDHVLDTDSVTNYKSVKTPLCAAAGSSLEKTRILMKAGADPYLSMIPGEIPLHHAALSNKFDIVKYFLIDCKIDYRQVFAVTIQGDTLRFEDLLAKYPYRNTAENHLNLSLIQNFLKHQQE